MILQPHQTVGSNIGQNPDGCYHLEVPSGPSGKYRWAQLDDYMSRSRSDFYWNPPIQLELQARVSSQDIPGTWGFGFWNDPFSLSIGMGGAARRLPAMPNTAWFFYASSPNYLSFSDSHPAQGMLAATFSSPTIPSMLLGLGLPAMPLLVSPVTARILRKLARKIIKEDGVQLHLDLTDWHQYSVKWLCEKVVFEVDGQTSLETPVTPRGCLGLVLWIDNQYAAFLPQGKISFGTLECSTPAWLDIKNINVRTPLG